MNWEAISAVGDLVSAIAVVVTLVFLTLQLRENTKNIGMQTVDTTFTEWNDILKDIQSIDGIGLIYFKALKGEALSELEEHQLTFLFRRIFNIYAKLQHRELKGLSDPFNSESVLTSLPYLFKVEFFSKWWPLNRDRYAVSFQQYLDESIAAGK